jgi:single-stranded-DNA-specific exonuclease
MRKRGLEEDFLRPTYDERWILDPFGLPDMEQAVARILRAREAREKVLIFGDYDADGVTAATVLKDGLEAIGVEVAGVMLPDRFSDGYGMNMGVLAEAERLGATLVMTVDCGSGSEEVIAALKGVGVETIVTDHHECPHPPASAVAVVNPKRVDASYANRDLAGVGVAYKVVCALAGRVKVAGLAKGWEKWLLDLVAIGTICDAMPLVGENRALVYWGLEVLRKGKRVGLKELLRVAGVREVDTMAVGFMIGPRVNAAGRLKDAYAAFELVNETKRVRAAALAEQLDKLNSERKAAQERAVAEARELVGDEAVIVVCGEWHEGIVGIVAGKLVEEFRRPAFVLARVDGGLVKGSARSFGEFDLAAAVEKVRGLLEKGGGHALAAGVTLQEEKLAEFRQALNRHYRALKLVDQGRFLTVRAEIETDVIGELGVEFYREMKQLEPFGEGNPEPVIALRGVIVAERRWMGANERHLALSVLGSDGQTLRLVAWSAPEEWGVEQGTRVDVLVQLVANEWRGVTRVEGRIAELRLCEE